MKASHPEAFPLRPGGKVDEFIQGMKVLNVRLGSTKAVMVYGELSEEAQLAAHRAGLEIGPISLQDLFIHLTGRNIPHEKTSSAVTRVSTDMFIHQGAGPWDFYLLSLIYIGVGIGTSIGVNVRAGIAEEDYFSITYRSTKGFMLVIGIISAYGFLSYYVETGLRAGISLKEPHWRPSIYHWPFRSWWVWSIGSSGWLPPMMPAP